MPLRRERKLKDRDGDPLTFLHLASHKLMHCQIVPEDSACFDGKNIRRDMLPGDHSKMCKFPDRNAIGYKRVVGHIKRLVVAARSSGGTGTDSSVERRKSWSASPISRGLLIEPAPHCKFDGETDQKEEEPTQRVTRQSA